MNLKILVLFFANVLALSLVHDKALAFTCAKNFSRWTRTEVINHPLELYERLQLRSQKTSTSLTLMDLEFIKSDLKITRSEAKRIFGSESQNWTDKVDSLLKANIPYRQLIDFYIDFEIALQYKFKSGEASDNLGFMSTVETANDFISKAEKHSPDGLPIFIIPIRGDLSMADFVKTNAVPLFYAGVTSRHRTRADGVVLGPADFFIHDLFHAEWIALGQRNALRKEPAGTNPIEKIRLWNQSINQKLNSENEKSLFIEVHEIGTVLK